jgi:phosphoribosylformimino-5-aminoimidazole carboxamide ribotide isomerase
MGKTVRIIPVLDLKGGQVVRARSGDRASYRPIITPLAESPDPVDVAHGLRTLYPFPVFYIADLDAIAGGAPNHEALSRLRSMESSPELWVDAGFAEAKAFETMLDAPGVSPILGSESQADDRLLRRFSVHPDLILSLDFFGDGLFRGPKSVLDQPNLWPRRVIVMTLAKVGSGSGPDFDRLAEIKAKAGDRDIVAAGGVRDEDDIRALAALGVSAALVATSLHNGALTAEHLAAL